MRPEAEWSSDRRAFCYLDHTYPQLIARAIDIGLTTIDENVDTTFYIKNIGDCSDLVEVYVSSATTSPESGCVKAL